MVDVVVVVVTVTVDVVCILLIGCKLKPWMLIADLFCDQIELKLKELVVVVFVVVFLYFNDQPWLFFEAEGDLKWTT